MLCKILSLGDLQNYQFDMPSLVIKNGQLAGSRKILLDLKDNFVIIYRYGLKFVDCKLSYELVRGAGRRFSPTVRR